MRVKRKSASSKRQDTEDTKEVTTNDKCHESEEDSFVDLVELDPEEPSNSKEVKGKYWCFVLYPESAPENWEEILNKSGLAWAMSPLHDKDLNADGGKKKAHYHVIICWQASTTYKAVKGFTKGTMKSTVPQVLHSPKGYYRYFTHADNPEKAQYKKEDIKTGNGFDIADYQKMTREEKLQLHQELSQIIIDNCIERYDDAVQMSMQMGFDAYEMLTTHTIHFINLCKSMGFRMRTYESERIDKCYSNAKSKDLKSEEKNSEKERKESM